MTACPPLIAQVQRSSVAHPSQQYTYCSSLRYPFGLGHSLRRVLHPGHRSTFASAPIG
jgi:hypothetical protein